MPRPSPRRGVGGTAGYWIDIGMSGGRIGEGGGAAGEGGRGVGGADGGGGGPPGGSGGAAGGDGGQAVGHWEARTKGEIVRFRWSPPMDCWIPPFAAGGQR